MKLNFDQYLANGMHLSAYTIIKKYNDIFLTLFLSFMLESAKFIHYDFDSSCFLFEYVNLTLILFFWFSSEFKVVSHIDTCMFS
jgi:hypothetical protein